MFPKQSPNLSFFFLLILSSTTFEGHLRTERFEPLTIWLKVHANYTTELYSLWQRKVKIKRKDNSIVIQTMNYFSILECFKSTGFGLYHDGISWGSTRSWTHGWFLSMISSPFPSLNSSFYCHHLNLSFPHNLFFRPQKK